MDVVSTGELGIPSALFRRGYSSAGRAVVRIGDKEWPTEYPNMEAPFLPFEVVSDTAVDEVLAALEFDDSVQISAEYRDFPLSRKNYPDFPRIEGMAPHFYRGTAVEEFQRCMERGGQ